MVQEAMSHGIELTALFVISTIVWGGFFLLVGKPLSGNHKSVAWLFFLLWLASVVIGTLLIAARR